MAMKIGFSKKMVLFFLVIGAIGGFAFVGWDVDLKKSHTATAQHVAFDESMLLSEYQNILERNDFQMVYGIFKDLYEKHNFKTLKATEDTRIPKLIHVMWLGGKLPEEFESYVASWKKYHPDWKMLFWTDSKENYARGDVVLQSFSELQTRLLSGKKGECIVIDSNRLAYENKKFYDAAINYGEKSDILKWEIVYRFGGVYVDTDFECLQPLDQYNHTFDLYTGLQPLDTNMVQLGAALYGAIPQHPILKACVEMIKHNQDIQQIIVKTGPIHFTKVFAHFAGKTGLRDVALPSSYFYPCGYEQRGTPQQEWCKNESFAVHHWAGSWLKKEAFVRE
jgi:inositol phosphorylceramide mannosyltransferase catalytic subunit